MSHVKDTLTRLTEEIERTCLYSTLSVLLASSLASQTHLIVSFFTVIDPEPGCGLGTRSIRLITRRELNHSALVAAVGLRDNRRGPRVHRVLASPTDGGAASGHSGGAAGRPKKIASPGMSPTATAVR